MPAPLIKVVQLTLTNRCQCHCKHCGVSKLRHAITGELTIEQIEAIFQDLELAGCSVVDLFGGEPTLRGDLFDIIQRGKSHGFFVSLETNGYAVDQAYVERLAEARLDQIYLSLDDYRPEVHDEIRGKKGSFDRAVRALELGARAGILMHVSTVPQTRDFFTSGDINRFMRFVLDHGAEKVRLLLPRFVGNSIHEDGVPLCAGEERQLFSHVSARYSDSIYVHTPGTPLGEKNICTAKQVFCHVMSNGWVAPCPYFPLVFGDATREPIIDVFERIQSHPLVRLGGEYCPMRNEDYIQEHIRELGLHRAFFPIAVDNQVDLGSPCGAECPDCSYGKRSAPRPLDEIVSAVAKVPREYTRIEFYGGDAFLRDDLFTVLECVPPRKKVILWSTGAQLPRSDAFGDHLRSYPIEAVKVRLSIPTDASGERRAGPAGLQEALRRVRALCSTGLPVHLYVPADVEAQLRPILARSIRHVGAERLYTFTRDRDGRVGNSVGCFGTGFGRVRILWLAREMGGGRPA
jgi:MoaA/NifB/PqqE/SkfB family radical SAM enzyme